MPVATLRAIARQHWRLLAVAVLAGLATIAWILHDASRAVQDARAAVGSPSAARVSVEPIDRAIPAGIQDIGAPSIFRDVAVFNGHLFVAGAHGLVEYDEGASPIRRLRTGLELPPAQIVSLGSGVLASSPDRELVMATATDGLVLFDGTHLRHVRAQQPERGRLTATLWLGGGRLLVGTEKSGVLVYSGGDTLPPAHTALADAAVTALAGSDGDVWIGTVDRGVLHWRGGEVERFDETAGLPDRRVLSLAAAGDRAYVGTALGVAEFADGQYVRTLGAGLFAGALTVRTDTLIVGTLDGTIARIPLSARSSRGARPIEQDAPAPISRFVETGGVLYAVTAGAVYTVDDRSGFHQVAGGDRTQLSDRNVASLALDGAGRLWVGYFDRGLDVLAADGQRISHVENDHVFCINRIVHDPQRGLTAVATANGLVLFDGAGRQRQVLGRADGLMANHVTDLVMRPGGMTLATPAGLTFLDADGSRGLYAFHGLVNNHVYALGLSGQTLVAGTLGGVSVLDSGIVRASYTAANSALTHNWTTAVVPVDEDWFVGTYGGGVFRMDRAGHWTSFADLPKDLVINPNAMAVTGTHVFAGTLSNGLLIYDRATGRWEAFGDGLPSMNVTAVAAAAGALYVGTDNGIVRIGNGALEHP